MRFMSNRRKAVITIICTCMFAGTLSGSAQQAPATPQSSPSAFVAPKFGIFPVGDYPNDWFELTIESGDTVQLTAGIANTGEVPATLRTYSANAYNPPNGGFAAGTDEDEATGATTWVTYPSDTFEMAPGDQRAIDFEVSIPADTLPGEYVTALVVQTDESLEVPGSETLRQFIRSAVSIEITVPGETATGFKLGEPVVTPAGGAWTLDVPITNTGTARVRPQGTLSVATADGEEVSTTDVEMGSVYGGNTTTVQVTLPGQLPLGEYLVSLDLTDEATGASASISDAPVTLAEPEIEEPETFVVDQASVTPSGDPIQYADVTATITNNGVTIPTANVTLNVQRDGEEVESYPLAQNQALLNGTTEFSQRYIPVDGWQPGTWTFELVISAVNGGTETVLASVEIADEIMVS
jgi:uncharacterized membrane protein